MGIQQKIFKRMFIDILLIIDKKWGQSDFRLKYISNEHSHFKQVIRIPWILPKINSTLSLWVTKDGNPFEIPGGGLVGGGGREDYA